ncbi:MAG: transposase [Thermodesulfobacteriota bacterium]
MPRQARLDVPGALHLMVRGIDKSTIFKDDEDWSRFLERLGENVVETQSSVWAWTFMENHIHLLVRSGRLGISALMRRLLTGYAQYYNRRHGRTGHLFENRYKSILCDEETYLDGLNKK